MEPPLPPAIEDRRINADMATREMALDPATWNADARTIDVTWTTGARGTRFNWTRYDLIDEELATDPGSVRLERLNGGAAVLNTHSQYELENQIGVVVPGSARMANGSGIATLQLSSRESVAPIVADIAAGIIRNISVGYIVHTYEVTEREGQRALYRAIDWEPTEISFVPVPFDAGAQVRSHTTAQGGFPCILRRNGAASLETEMEDRSNTGGAVASTTTDAAQVAVHPETRQAEQIAQPIARFTASTALALVEQARAFGDTVVQRANELVAQNERGEVSIEQARAEILASAASAQRAATSGVSPGAQAIVIPEAQFAARGEAMANAILARANPSQYQLDDNAREFRGQNLRSLARGFLEATGTRTAGMSDVDVARTAMTRSVGMHTTSDFPNILGSVVRRSLRDAYQLAPRTYQAWARRTNSPDFRDITRVAFSDAPSLSKVEEHGEYTYGTMGESAEKFRVAKYGKIIAVTWEAIINDDLNALTRIPAAFGQSAAQTESDIAYSLLIDNRNMSDGYALFSTQHANLAATGAAIAIETLSAGRTAMRVQKSPGGAVMSVMPGILLVGPNNELAAYQYTSANYVPVSAGTINPDYNRNLMVVVDPRITGNAWFLIADPAGSMIDTIEYAYLDGEEGVMIEQRQGFEIDGLEIKARLVFGAGVIDYRGMFKNPGQ